MTSITERVIELLDSEREKLVRERGEIEDMLVQNNLELRQLNEFCASLNLTMPTPDPTPDNGSEPKPLPGGAVKMIEIGNENRKKIISALNYSGPSTAKEIAEILDTPVPTISNHLVQMVDEGRLTRKRRDNYTGGQKPYVYEIANNES